MSAPKRPTPLVLLIIDGYGISFIKEGNAVLAAKQPNMDRLMREYPLAVVQSGGEEVGLPWGEMGNSETGHQNIGSGRVQYQFLPRIDKAIADESFFKNEALQKAIKHVQKHKDAALHTMGMLSNGGVHSHIKHQFALLKAAADAGIGDRTYIHIFLDGRDTSPDDADSFVGQLEKYAKKVGAGVIETIVGRYYAMDRAQNWDRIEDAYNLLTKGKGKKFDNWKDAMRDAFASGDKRSYEIATPRITTGDTPFRPITSNDAVVFYNYRSDRARQLTAAFADPHFSEFPTQPLKNLVFVTMTSYDREVPTDVMFEDEELKNTLGEVIADHNLTQLRIAESEKFAHVTYFFNGGREKPYRGEKDVKVPSLKTKDFSKHPEMSAKEITDKVVHAIERQAYDVIVMNYANPDMVGHTGKFKPTIKAVEVVDEQLGRVVEAALKKGGGVLITCDHGNAESCINQITHEISTDHNNNPVPVIYVGPDNKQEQPKDEGTMKQILSTPIGFLADVAPTTLEILGIKKPKEMTAQSLLKSLV